jgi:hypothetical protein
MFGWTKVRLIARVATHQDEQQWIGLAQGMTAQVLSKEVRNVDRKEDAFSASSGSVRGDIGPALRGR